MKRETQIKRARELLVRFCNRAEILRDWPNHKLAQREVQRRFDRLKKVPTDILREAAEQLNAREQRWAEGFAEIRFRAIERERGL